MNGDNAMPKPTHGGARAGAGRKPGNDWTKDGEYAPSQRKAVLLRLEPQVIEWLKSQGGSMSDVTNRLILSEMHEGPLVAAKK